jgi:hypothetical protein
MKFKFKCLKIKSFWYTAMLIHLHIVYGCFHAKQWSQAVVVKAV